MLQHRPQNSSSQKRGKRRINVSIATKRMFSSYYILLKSSFPIQFWIWWSMGSSCHHDWFPNPHVLPLDLSVVLRRKASLPVICRRHPTVLVENVGPYCKGYLPEYKNLFSSKLHIGRQSKFVRMESLLWQFLLSTVSRLGYAWL